MFKEKDKKNNKIIKIILFIFLSTFLISGAVATYFSINLETKVTTNKTQQDTIYIDKKGKKIKTNERNLSNIDSKEVTQFGFYQNENEEIQAVKMPKTIEKVPNKLPAAITSTKGMFEQDSNFNQDISQWNTSNVTNMSYVFNTASTFNQDISQWNVKKVTQYDNFSTNSGIDNNSNNPNKLPTFN